MVTKDELSAAAFEFLRAVAETAKAELGPYPTRHQKSIWMVRSGPSKMSGQTFRRDVLDREAISIVYQKRAFDPFPEQEHLENLLGQADIEVQQTRYSYALPLVDRWLDSPDPFALNEDHLSKVLDEFSDAVLKNEVTVRSRDGIHGLKMASAPLVLEEGMRIRQIADEELWELGDTDNLRMGFPNFSWPMWLGEDWLVLDISLPCKTLKAFPPDDIGQTRRTILIALRLLCSGCFRVRDLGCEASHGMGAAGRSISGEGTPTQYGVGQTPYVLDECMAERLRQSWPHIRRITESPDHYLRIPAMRLLDGGSRLRPDDAIIDYAIGLEALLLFKIHAELSYRFALRGATVLTWEKPWKGSDKTEVFSRLRDFYDMRSKIIHGQKIDRSKLADTRSFGELALRDIWWWYFEKRKKRSTATVSMIDKRILT